MTAGKSLNGQAKLIALSSTVIALLSAAPAQAVEVDSEPTPLNNKQPIAVPEPKRRGIAVTAVKPTPPADTASAPIPTPLFASDGKWVFGGAIRFRTTTSFDDVNPRTGGPDARSYYGIDTGQLKASYDSSTLFAAAQYNIYGGAYPYNREAGYKQYFGEMSFLKFAYGGVKVTPTDSVSVGLQQVPFGIMPYFGVSFIETLGYNVGIEDNYNVGVKYSHVEPDLNYQLAYFPSDGGNYFGISRDSARYGANIVRTDSYVQGGSNNVEQNMLVGRAEYTFYRGAETSATVGASVLHSTIYNYDTMRAGSRQQEALHFVGTYGSWTARAVATRLDINPANPGSNSLITMGSFDGSYNVATKGYLVSAELAYTIKPDAFVFSEITPYLNYSAYYKDHQDFQNSERVIFGSAYTVRDIPGLYIYTEFRFGRNDIYTGAGNYSQGLGAGGTNRWATTYLTNIGYYF